METFHGYDFDTMTESVMPGASSTVPHALDRRNIEVEGDVSFMRGLLYGLLFTQIYYTSGVFPGLKAFTAAVLGGIGNIPGAVLGGLFLGVIESVGPTLFLDGLGVPSPNQLKDVIAFTLLVLVLIFRPEGILGERVSRRA